MNDAVSIGWSALLEVSGAARSLGADPAEAELRPLRQSLDRLRRGGFGAVHLESLAALLDAMLSGPLVIAQIGQSLDGRIATESGHSHYINGPESLDHLHRLRALVDAVVIGASTAVLDNPRLTTRRVEGPNPTRVVIDPNRRVPSTSAVLSDGAARSYRLTTQQGPQAIAPAHEIPMDAADGTGCAPASVLSALRSRGLNHILIEGGADTVSRFLAAGQVDRLHVLVAPVILGSGRLGLRLPVIDRMDQAFRPATRTYAMGADVLFDCDLASAGSAGR